nr:MAG TPA: hypothetical protein [Caudoviricetes sp.]
MNFSYFPLFSRFFRIVAFVVCCSVTIFIVPKLVLIFCILFGTFILNIYPHYYIMD